MENSIMVAEDCLRTDSNPVSSAKGSLIKINSISIDLLNANGGDAEKCEHFSIRGYVSKVRKKNKKICWPFPMDDNDNKPEAAKCLLPPLDVQKFRWWRCKNCLQDIVAGCAIKDNETVSYPCGFKTTATCSHESSLGAVVLPLDYQQPPKQFLIEGRKFDANTFKNMANNEDLPLSRSKERKSEVENNTLIGHGNGSTGTRQENASPSCVAAKVNPCNEEKHANESGAPNPKCNGSVGGFKVGTIASEELNNASSESDEIKSHGVPRRKFRKVRLLAELLGDNGVAKTDCMKTSGSCSNEVSDVFLRQGTVSVLQGPVAVQGGNVRQGFMGQNRKRKLPQDEEWRPPAASSLNNENMMVMASEDAETESEEDVVVGENRQIGSNCSLTKHKVEKDTTLAKKKNKKTQVIDLNKSHSESGDISEADGTTDVLLSSVQDTFMDQGTDLFPSHDQRMKRKSNLYESESKMRQVDDGPAPVNPLHDGIFAADPTAGKDMDVTQTKILTVPIQSAQQAPSGKRLDLSLNSYLTATRYDKIYSPQAGGGLPSSSPWHEDPNQGMREGIDTNFVGDSRVFSKPALNGVYGNGVNVDPTRKGIMYNMPYLNDKHKHSSQAEDGVCSSMQQMPFSNPSDKEKAVEDQEHLAVTKKHTSRRADKNSEQGTLDDIPMEIVELMAKNQYERCLHDAKREKQHPDNRSAQILDFTAGGYGNKEFRSLPNEATHKQKPQAKNGRDGIRVTGDYMGPTKRKFHENPSSEVQFYAASSSGHSGPQNCLWIGDRSRPKVRSSYSTMQPFSACNTCQTQPQHSKEAAGLWPSTIPNHTPFGFSVSQKCEAQSTNVEMFSRRPSSLHKRDHAMKFTNANAGNHGKHQRKNLGSDTLVRTHPDYSFGCKHRTDLPKKITGSLDLYSNETIPAMHLLSLMDAGVRSGASSGREESQKLQKKPLFPGAHHSKEFPAQQLGASHEYFPAIQIGGASTSSFQQNRNFQRVANFTGQVPLKSPQKAKIKTHKIPSESGHQKSHKFSLEAGEDMFLGDLQSPSSFFQSRLIGFPARKQKLDANVSTQNVWPLRSNVGTESCSVNRNPADFSIPGARNGYMIRGEDLKFRKRFPTCCGSSLNKIHKNVKLSAANECVRQRNRGDFYQQ